MTWLKWLLSIPYHLFMLGMVFLILILPFMTLGNISQVITHEVPVVGTPFIIFSIFGFWLYLALRVPFLRGIYSKVPVLIPLLQLLLLTTFVLNIGLLFLNKWADQALYSKPVAIFLMLLSIVLGRGLMSWWYTKYPLTESMKR